MRQGETGLLQCFEYAGLYPHGAIRMWMMQLIAWMYGKRRLEKMDAGESCFCIDE